MLTAIVPVDLSQRALDIIHKSINMARAAELEKVRIVFGHNDRGDIYDKIFLRLITKFKSVSIVSEQFYDSGINTSILRNEAFTKVVTKNIVLLDIDIWPDFKLIKKYSDRVEAGYQPFYILPCLYLTKHGSKKLISRKCSVSELTEKFYKFSRKEFLHLASPSSVTILKSYDYKVINGFNTKFVGHGYEDFDFLVRISLHYKKIEAATDFMINKTAHSPLFTEGFRRYLGELCLEVLIEKEMVFHLYHDKPRGTKYYAARPDNFIIFVKQHEGLSISNIKKETTLLTQFIKICAEKEISIHEHSILFDNKPGHIDRFDTFKRRLRFLFNG